MIDDSSTSHNPEEDEDFEYQGKRPDQVDYSEKVMAYMPIAIILLLIASVWEACL